jgi:hypothetical protein
MTDSHSNRGIRKGAGHRFQPQIDQIDPDYLFLWVHSPQFSEQIDPGRSNGVPHISSKQVEAALIFIPPSPSNTASSPGSMS